MLAAIALFALGLLAFGAVSGKLRGGPLTAPIWFTALGLGLGQAAPFGLALENAQDWIHVLAEGTLVLILFTDASRLGPRDLSQGHDLPIRLLLLGLPLAIAAGGGAALLVHPGFDWAAALLLGAILAPTDAALGLAVITDRGVPVRIRQALNVESGINDGLALPAVLFCVHAAVSSGSESTDAGHWLGLFLAQVTLGPLIGSLVGFLGGRLAERSTHAGWMNAAFQQITVLGLAFLAFAGASALGGNGFLAAWVAGMVVGASTKEVKRRLLEFGEVEGQLLSFLTFTAFGAYLLPFAWERFEARHLLFAALSLTLVRMVPTALALLGKGLRPSSVLFLGWFGPRGIASILFSMIVLEEGSIAGVDQLLTIATTTIALSILLHGMTAGPLARLYGRHLEALAPHLTEEERKGLEETPLRTGSD